MKNKFQILALLISFISYKGSNAQHEVPDSLKYKNYQQVIPLPKVENGGASVIQRQPMYPNGADGILKHIQENLVYPIDALENKIEGTVIVKFIIDTNGNISNISIVESIYPSLDTEAIRIISQMDKWLPAIQRNKPQKVAFKQPVAFTIEDTKKKKKKKKKQIK